ncbi:MAG: condensation domain-containing protein, partial [Rhodoplanes sp.]
MSLPENMFPLSAAQLGIWLDQQINLSSPRYNFGEYLEFNAPLNPALFEQALRHVVAETEALRVRIVDDGEEPRQAIDSSPHWSMPIIDFSAEPDWRTCAEAWMNADLAQPVDLSTGPLFGFALFKTSAEQFLWYARYHHIVMDGFSMGLVARRVAEIYTQLCAGQIPSRRAVGALATLLEDEANYRASEQYAKDRKYWLENFANRPDPIGFAGRPVAASDGKIRSTTYLDEKCAEALRSIARRAGASTPQIITATTAIFLHRLIGETDLIIGLAATARTRVSRRIPGMVANVLPLRLALRPSMSVADVVEQTAAQMRRGLRHQRYPIAELRRETRGFDGRPPFALSVNIMPFDYDFQFAGYNAIARNLSLGPVDDISIPVYDRSNGGPIQIDFDANPARYEADDLAGYQERFLRLLEGAVADPGRAISALDILSAAERRVLLHDWNDTARALPSATLPALFAAQAERTPEAVAVVGEDQTLSYGELEARANRLAHHLRGLGVGPEVVVGLCVERSAAMVVGLLGILKAGGA